MAGEQRGSSNRGRFYGNAKIPDGQDATPVEIKPIQGGILNGRAISKPAPEYPPVARAARVTGEIEVDIIVDEEGYVIVTKAAGGHPLLQQAAVNAARRARFTPTLLDGRPVKVKGVSTYDFVLR